VAVLGCGADIDYPASARRMLELVRLQHLVVSEVPWECPPTRYAFPRRNRIIAALSGAVLVVEAGLPSGTFSTADAALDLGRSVLAVPGSINSPESRGSNRLIRQGAAPITDVSDLSSELSAVGILTDTRSDGDCLRTPTGPLEHMLAADPMRPDDVARALDVDIVAAIRELGMAEMEGRIVRCRDGRYGLPLGP
jgi:DNA processing protein